MPCPLSLLLAGLALAAQAVKPPSYESLVERYARGERAEALAGLGLLSYNDAIQGYGELKAAADRLGKPIGAADAEARAQELARVRGLLRAAVMLHWDHDDAARPPSRGVEQPRPCPGRHAELAGRYATLLARWPETREFAKRFFLTVSNTCQWDACLDSALRSARDGLKLFPRDAQLLFAVGGVLEEDATQSPVKSREGIGNLRGGERDRRLGLLVERENQFRESRRHLEQALEIDPGLTLARVRLGRVLWQLDEWDAAAVALRQAIADRPEQGVLSMAHLFLGRVHEDSGRLEQAAAEYRQALELDPIAQAPAVALSHALGLAGDSQASRRVLADALRHAGRRQAADLYWNYLASNAFGFESDFDALRRDTLR